MWFQVNRIIFNYFYSTNSNEVKSLTATSSTNGLCNDKFDFKFQVPKFINSSVFIAGIWRQVF